MENNRHRESQHSREQMRVRYPRTFDFLERMAGQAASEDVTGGDPAIDGEYNESQRQAHKDFIAAREGMERGDVEPARRRITAMIAVNAHYIETLSDISSEQRDGIYGTMAGLMEYLRELNSGSEAFNDSYERARGESIEESAVETSAETKADQEVERGELESITELEGKLTDAMEQLAALKKRIREKLEATQLNNLRGNLKHSQ